MADHGDYLKTGVKHTEDVRLPAGEVDYISIRPYRFFAWLYRPIRPTKKETKHILRLVKEKIKNATLSFLSMLGIKNAHERGIKKIFTLSQ